MKRFLYASLAAATLLSAGPALAGGTISIVLTPDSREEAIKWRKGLAVASYRQGAHVSQAGDGNNAGITQDGRRNLGVIRQDGDDHDASLTQTGNRNAYGIFQFGEGAEADVSQFGRRKTGILIQYGF